MPLISLNDLFDVMKKIIAPKYNLNPTIIKTKIIGIRPGEKITEYLLTDFELENVLETKDFFIMPSMFDSVSSKKYKNAKKPKNIKNYFEKLKPISKLEIQKMLNDVY
jgi:FlaA1/EpsC-like NDP-sugar epimerase